MEQRANQWLGDLPFSDLMITEDPRNASYKQVSDSLEVHHVPERYWDRLKALYDRMERVERDRFREQLEDGDRSLMLRIQRRDTPNYRVYAARRIDSFLLPIEKLGIAPAILRRLRAPQLRPGGVIFCGRPGAGKTVTACSLMVDRLVNIGGFTWTAENPVEHDIQAALAKRPVSRGQCFQVDLESDDGYGRAYGETLRCGADTFYVGEIREEHAATTACLAANSGMLVLSTLHADNIKQAVTKLGSMAGFSLFAESVRAILVLRLEHRSGPGPRTVLHVEPLFVTEESTRIKIREQNLAALTQEIEQQRYKLQMETPISARRRP